MSATMRYYTTDILSGAIVGDELPFYGINFNKRMSQPGIGTFTFRLGTNIYNDQSIVDATQPGKLALNCERNGELIWAGPIWTRTYASVGKTAQLSVQTWESVFEHVVFEEHVIQQKIEQSIIFQNLVNQLQAQPNCNFGFTMNTPFPTTGLNRTVLLPNYEFHYAWDAFSQLIDTDDGLEYSIDSDKLIRVGFPKLSSASSDAFDFPGTIANYWLPENAGRGGVKFAGIGAGTGNKVIRAVAVDGDKLAAGWPAWYQVRQYPLVVDQDIMNARVRDELATVGAVALGPTFQLDNADLFTSWNGLGNTFTVTIEDARFPSGTTMTNRLVGWEYSPASSENDEQLMFTIEGAD